VRAKSDIYDCLVLRCGEVNKYYVITDFRFLQNRIQRLHLTSSGGIVNDNTNMELLNSMKETLTKAIISDATNQSCLL